MSVALLALEPAVVRAGDGAAIFTQNCQLCHQSGGVGLAGTFPRLAGRVAIISANPAGRAYLVHVLTYGMAGKITVDKQPLIGVMPPFAQLSEDDVASVLNYVQTLGTEPRKPPSAFSAAEVAVERAKPAKTAADVLAERQTLGKGRFIE